MSPSTAAPGRWQLPGGSVEPPEDGRQLDEAALRRNAARELFEEMGVDTPPEDLQLWAATRGAHSSIGVSHLAPPRPETALREYFETVTATERAQGRNPELDQIMLVRSPAELAHLTGPHADYLEPVLRRYVQTQLRRDAVARHLP